MGIADLLMEVMAREERFLALGMVWSYQGRYVLVVAYPYRKEKRSIRIISARKTKERERKLYGQRELVARLADLKDKGPRNGASALDCEFLADGLNQRSAGRDIDIRTAGVAAMRGGWEALRRDHSGVAVEILLGFWVAF